jgi:hypothetical protein
LTPARISFIIKGHKVSAPDADGADGTDTKPFMAASIEGLFFQEASMSIIRVNKTKNYTVMSNHHLQNRNLTLKAKGLLSEMLSLPENWDYTITGLARINRESEAAIKSALRELKAEGYLQIRKLKPNETESGRIEYIYDIYEEPKQEGEKQEAENQPLEILPLENHGQLNTNILNTNNKIYKEERKKENQETEEPETFDSILASVDVIKNNPELKAAFYEFIKMRKLIKAPLTNEALKLNIKRAREFGNDDPEAMTEIVLQSVRNSWRGLFPVHNESRGQGIARNTPGNNPFTELREAEGYTI